MSQKDPVVVAL